MSKEHSIDSNTAPYAAFVLRVSLGVMFIAHGLLKVMVFTPAGTVKFFESIGLPGPLAYAVITAELAGGVLILLGVYSRWVSAALVPVLLGALSVHAGNGWLFTSPGGGWEYPLFLATTAMAQALLGDGKFALANIFSSGPARQRMMQAA